MVFALFELLFLMGLAGLPAWYVWGALGACSAALLVVSIYALVLAWRVDRFDRWLGAPSLRLDPPWQGVWRDMALRIQRMLRQQEKLVTVHEKRLQDFLSAIQASPNGVILLDEEARIEWCNETAASHLGLDSLKDRMQHIVHLVRDPVFSRYFSQASHASEPIRPAKPARRHKATAFRACRQVNLAIAALKAATSQAGAKKFSR